MYWRDKSDIVAQVTILLLENIYRIEEKNFLSNNAIHTCLDYKEEIVPKSYWISIQFIDVVKENTCTWREAKVKHLFIPLIYMSCCLYWLFYYFLLLIALQMSPFPPPFPSSTQPPPYPSQHSVLKENVFGFSHSIWCWL